MDHWEVSFNDATIFFPKIGAKASKAFRHKGFCRTDIAQSSCLNRDFCLTIQSTKSII